MIPGSHLANPRLRGYKALASDNPREHAVDIRYGRGTIGILLPALFALAADDLQRLSDGRNRQRGAFFSEQASTADSTRRWLEGVAQQDARILFLVAAAGGTIAGHIAVTRIDEARGTGETDAWLGIGGGPPGIMLLGFATLIEWALDTLGLHTLNAQVFSDNATVIRAHEMLGFARTAEVPFSKTESDGGVSWQPGDTGVIRMVSQFQLDREAFAEPAARVLRR